MFGLTWNTGNEVKAESSLLDANILVINGTRVNVKGV